VDHVVNKSNMHMNDEDVNNADVNKVREDIHEKPEKRDVVDDINPEGKHNDEKNVEKQVHEKPEERDGASSSSITYYNRQSSTKTEAVARYVEIPVLNHLVQLVTPLSNPGPEKPEKRDVMTDTNPEGRYDDMKAEEASLQAA
jgi:hypothetical protein